MKKGFSFIEVLVICAIYGTIASVSIPAFTEYRNNSVTSEAKVNLRSISNGALAFYESEHYSEDGMHAYTKVYPYCGSSMNGGKVVINGCKSGANPIGKPASATSMGTKYNPNDYSSAFSSELWSSLRFFIYSPFSFYYDYVSNGDLESSAFSAKASASIERPCDSVFNISGLSDGRISVIVDMSGDIPACNYAKLPSM